MRARQWGTGLCHSRGPPDPPCSAGHSAKSLTVSRKAKKGVPRPTGHPGRVTIQAPLPPPGSFRGAAATASRAPPLSSAPRNSDLLLVVLQGGEEWVSYGPEAGSVAGGLWTKQDDIQVTWGTRVAWEECVGVQEHGQGMMAEAHRSSPPTGSMCGVSEPR